MNFSKEEIIEILSVVDDPHLKTTLKLINNGVELASALLVGVLSLATEREKLIKNNRNVHIQMNEFPSGNDLS